MHNFSDEYFKAIDAIMDYRGCSFKEATSLLLGYYPFVKEKQALNNGKYEALFATVMYLQEQLSLATKEANLVEITTDPVKKPSDSK